jgi:hypothetical protein
MYWRVLSVVPAKAWAGKSIIKMKRYLSIVKRPNSLVLCQKLRG